MTVVIYSQLEQEVTKCIENGNPSAAGEILSDRLSSVLPKEESKSCYKALKEVFLTNKMTNGDDSLMLSSFSLAQLIHERSEEKSDASELLRQIQFQSTLRLYLLANYENIFEASFAKWMRREAKRFKIKKKVLPQTDILFADVTRLLSLAALLLSPEQSFVGFLTECLSLTRDLSMRQRFFDFFEVQNPDEKSEASTALVLSPPQKRKPPAAAAAKRKRVVSEQPAHKKKTILERNNNNNKHGADSLFSTQSVRLTAPAQRRNSLLAGSKTRFVGSHFNTNLSNMETLFRQVKSRPVAQMAKKPSSKTVPTTAKQSNVPATSSAKPSTTTATSKPSALFRQKSSTSKRQKTGKQLLATSTNLLLSPQPTHRPTGGTMRVQETPGRGAIVQESPQKPSRMAAAIVVRRPPVQQQSRASMVAQAMRATRRRGTSKRVL